MEINFNNIDCIEFMKTKPNNYYDLAIVDPPYGIQYHKEQKKGGKGRSKLFKIIEWDNAIPTDEYFNELKRVSKNQIIWGGNYFLDYLQNTRCFIIWDKCISEDMSLSMCEMAWTSFDERAKIYKLYNQKGSKIHPTQKPVALYKWILDKYAKQGDKILDTHLGSGSIAIACHDYGFDLTACELDKEYYDKAMERIKNHTNQQKLF